MYDVQLIAQEAKLYDDELYDVQFLMYNVQLVVQAGSIMSPRSRSRGPGERAGISAAEVLDTARAISAAEGLAALTMRRIADELGVMPNTLYSYFPDKAALLAALIDVLLGEVSIPDVDRVDWRTGLATLMRASRKLLITHHELIPLFLAGPTRGPNALRLGEATLALLARGGIEGKAAVDALRILLIFTFGFAAQEAPRLKRGPASFSGAPVDLPRTRALEGELARHPDDAVFDQGLAWLLAGIAGASGGRRSGARTPP